MKKLITFESACAEAMQNKELVANYDRLYNANLAEILSASGINAQIDDSTGRKKDEILKFCAFFDEFVWSRLPENAFINK